MPIPQPKTDESQDDFVERCMADDVMTEYDQDQRAAICYKQWNERAAPAATRRMVLRADMAVDQDDDRAVTVTCSTEMLGRDKIVLMTRGVQLENYRANPVWLWQHNPDWPIARSETIDAGDNLVSRVRFPPAGVSARADEVLGLIRAGVISAASTGFETIASELIDRNNPRSGTRITKWELQEMSFVSIPAVPDALVTERSLSREEVEAMVERAVGRAAANAGGDATTLRAAVIGRLTKRGLYEVGQLAWMLGELGWIKSSVEWEAEIEQDGSVIPAQLGEAMKALGDVLIGMTAEEVAELVGGGEAVEEIIEPDEAAIVTQAKTPAIARFLIGMRRAQRVAQPKPAVASAPKSEARRRYYQNLVTRIQRDLTAA